MLQFNVISTLRFYKRFTPIYYAFERLLYPLRLLFIRLGIAASRNSEITTGAGELVKNNLFSTLFMINNEKSYFNPKTKGKWLRTIIDTIKMTSTVPFQKS